MSRFGLLAVVSGLIAFTSVAMAETADDSSGGSTRYGAFGLLDHRSTYGTYWFPEPLHVDEMDVDREFRVDYFHGENHRAQSDEVRAEIEWNFDQLTIECGIPYHRDSESEFDPELGRTVRNTADGVGNIEFAARFPVFEYVDPAKRFDYTLAAGL